MTRVVLVGFMGAGKTTVGRLLADELGWSFVDLDAFVEQSAGRSVPELFREEGEQGFRREELRAARQLRARTRCVIAAGGGAFAEAETRKALAEGAFTVWLRCDPAEAARRLAGDTTPRPLAANRATMAALYAQREPAYRSADLSIDTTGREPSEAARQIAQALRDQGFLEARRTDH